MCCALVRARAGAPRGDLCARVRLWRPWLATSFMETLQAADRQATAQGVGWEVLQARYLAEHGRMGANRDGFRRQAQKFLYRELCPGPGPGAAASRASPPSGLAALCAPPTLNASGLLPAVGEFGPSSGVGGGPAALVWGLVRIHADGVSVPAYLLLGLSGPGLGLFGALCSWSGSLALAPASVPAVGLEPR